MNILELRRRPCEDDECWTLDRIPHSSGYVYVQIETTSRSLEAHNAEPIPEGMVVCLMR